MYTTITKKHKDYYNFQSDFINTFKNYGDIILVDGNFEYKYKKFKDYFNIFWYSRNTCLIGISYYNYSGKVHREDGPARLYYHDNGKISNKEYYINGKLHRENGPADIWYDKNGKLIKKQYVLNDKKYSYTEYIEKLKCIQQ